MVRAMLATTFFVLAASVGGSQAAGPSAVYLGIRVSGVGGSVMANPSGYLDHCSGGRCVFRFDAGSRVDLTATASASGTHFARWLGACAGSSPTCSLTMDQNKVVTARFSPVQLYVEPTPGQGGVVASPGGSRCDADCTAYAYGTVVTLSAESCCGYTFDHWAGWCSSVSGDTCQVTMFDNGATTPVFRCVESCVGVSQEPLSRDVNTTVEVHGHGVVQLNGNNNCNSTCSFQLSRGQTLVLRTVGQDSRFLGWSGSCAGSSPRCQTVAFRDAYGRPPLIRAFFSP
jgi:hypothetical protein